MNFGELTSPEEAFAIMDAASAAGINWFDTSNSYGPTAEPGLSERIIGDWLDQRQGARDELIISSKVYRRIGQGPNEAGLSKLHVRRSVERSLRHLKTDRLDVLVLHHVDRATDLDATLEEVERLISSGLVTYVATSNFAGWHLVQAKAAAMQRNLFGPIFEQGVYNLAERMIELEVLPACEGLGLGFIAYSPLCNGLLAARNPSSPRQVKPRVAARSARIAEPIEAYFNWCHARGLDSARVALAWAMRRQGVTATLLGPRTTAHLERSLAALDLVLSPGDLEDLDGIWPGPGRAPEAYAW